MSAPGIRHATGHVRTLPRKGGPVFYAKLKVPRDDGTMVFCPDAECYLEAFKKFKGRYPKGLPRKFPRASR